MLTKKQYNKQYHQERPWLRSFYNARRRCKDGEYAKKGIKFLMSKEYFKRLWEECDAGRMDKPSIHRINPDKDYTYLNCTFIEFLENVTKSRRTGKTHSELTKQKIRESQKIYHKNNPQPKVGSQWIAKQHFKDHREELDD